MDGYNLYIPSKGGREFGIPILSISKVGIKASSGSAVASNSTGQLAVLLINSNSEGSSNKSVFLGRGDFIVLAIRANHSSGIVGIGSNNEGILHGVIDSRSSSVTYFQTDIKASSLSAEGVSYGQSALDISSVGVEGEIVEDDDVIVVEGDDGGVE